MPLYDYRCEVCGHEFEANRPIERRDRADCPRCKSPKTKRLVRSVGFFGGSRGGGNCGTTRSGFG